jgi:hypothetical protein
MAFGDKTPERDAAIFRRAVQGEKPRVLAKEYGITASSIQRIVHKGLWRIYRFEGPYWGIQDARENCSLVLELFEKVTAKIATIRVEEKAQAVIATRVKAEARLVSAKARLVTAEAALVAAEAALA